MGRGKKDGGRRRRTEPVPMVMAICADRRKARIEKSGRARSARIATLTANAAELMKIADMMRVPQKCSMTVASSSTPIDAHSHIIPSSTP